MVQVQSRLYKVQVLHQPQPGASDHMIYSTGLTLPHLLCIAMLWRRLTLCYVPAMKMRQEDVKSKNHL